MGAAFSGEQPTWPSPDDWGREERLQELLGNAFELELQERVWWLEGKSPEDVWELMSNGAPPVSAVTLSMTMSAGPSSGSTSYSIAARARWTSDTNRVDVTRTVRWAGDSHSEVRRRTPAFRSRTRSCEMRFP